MDTNGTSQNGHSKIDEAIAHLIQTQAAFVQNQALFLGRIAESERATAERFARIEANIAAILRTLADHSRQLDRLPEAVREKIGFRPPAPPAS